MKGRTYRYFEGEVLYPFGYGLSYTDFSYSKPQLSKNTMRKDETNTVSVTLTNTGNFDGETVVQLYINDKESSVTSPLKSLRKFRKIYLKKGASQTVVFEITPSDLSITDQDGNSFVESGLFEIYVGLSSATINMELLRIR